MDSSNATNTSTSTSVHGRWSTKFCDPWSSDNTNSKIDRLGAYTDSDLAADLNAMSFAERQAMEADIHGVNDVIEETPEFMTDKIKKMRQALDFVNPRRRQAWDRAAFLRPGLAEDRSMHLMFLRARRFRPDDAAEMMVAYFQAKRDLFGDDLLIHRITWDDVGDYISSL